MNDISPDLGGNNAAVIDNLGNRGGTAVRDGLDNQFGRRVEADRSWTIYHVYSGVPAYFGGRASMRLSLSDATLGMISLNRRNKGVRSQRTKHFPAVMKGAERP
ncbi:hypothetical protein QBK99_21350 [Corticibacterium sp. UT-5YL-CI-8]|nr:hypothetical protein [Tianweitania sp. UT-5YL-CI-8]